MDGPTHRYMLSAPGCWAIYGQLQADGRPKTQFSVDGYAVQHPGVPGPQASQSVCVHLMNLCRVIERGGDPAVGPRFLASLTHRRYPWLEPPDLGAYTLTVMDLAAVEPERFAEVEREFAEGAWRAWSAHHATIRSWLDDDTTLPTPL